ncbi:MAG: 6-carboxytetrahydropterin synthase, partial [Planctomycetes bacterium]|nr:6-carboxytetrahydropterin synthase [Planctomycetota bacterium]
VCERLHGHDYRVAAEVHGPLDENHYVVDFVALADAVKTILNDLDHHVLLPTGHPRITVRADDDEVEVRFQERRWVFPRSDCVLLPIPNTTTELLARHVGLRLIEALETRCGIRPSLVRIEIDECRGQSAVCELRDD